MVSAHNFGSRGLVPRVDGSPCCVLGETRYAQKCLSPPRRVEANFMEA